MGEEGVTSTPARRLKESVAGVPATHQVQVRQVQYDILPLCFRDLLFNEFNLVCGVHVLSLLGGLLGSRIALR